MKLLTSGNLFLTFVIAVATTLCACKSTFPTADTTVEYQGQVLKPVLNPTTRPSFPGGNQEMARFIKSNFKLPEEATSNETKGKVRIVLVITKEGEICDTRITSQPHKYLDNELIRVVKLMPKWTPATNNGLNVDSYYMLDLQF